MLITCLYPLCTAFLTFFQSCWGVRAQPKRQTDQIGFLTKNGRTTPLTLSSAHLQPSQPHARLKTRYFRCRIPWTLRSLVTLKMSTFGTLFRVTTYGESHCASVGAIIDGCPPVRILFRS